MVQSKDELIIGAMQLVREEARGLDRAWSKRVIFSVAGELITAWLLAPNGQKFAIDTFHYASVDPQAVLSLCDAIWESAPTEAPPPPPEVTDAELAHDDGQARAHVHSFLEVEHTFPEDVEIGYQGQVFRIKGGVPVKVPQCILQTWLDAMKEQEEAMGRMAEMISHPPNLTG